MNRKKSSKKKLSSKSLLEKAGVDPSQTKYQVDVYRKMIDILYGPPRVPPVKSESDKPATMMHEMANRRIPELRPIMPSPYIGMDFGHGRDSALISEWRTQDINKVKTHEQTKTISDYNMNPKTDHQATLDKVESLATAVGRSQVQYDKTINELDSVKRSVNEKDRQIKYFEDRIKEYQAVIEGYKANDKHYLEVINKVRAKVEKKARMKNAHRRRIDARGINAIIATTRSK